MSPAQICPDCGHANPEGAEHCESCNFPLRAGALSAAPAVAADAASGAAPEPPAPAQPPLIIPRPLGRPARRAAPLPGQSVSLWLFFGAVAGAILIWTAIDATRKRQIETSPVAGSNATQQQAAEAAQQALARDSSNVDAHVALANVLYDTGNWDTAIVHYRAALRRDSTRVAAIVDLGVCYYNLGDTPEAERLFHVALSRDPHQSVALFNLGIVNERRQQFAEALAYYRRALDSGPSEDARPLIADGVTRMEVKTGKRRAALPNPAGPP